ncbi:MAG: amidohydrolase [Thermodesulfobacteriota bacterium]|nr:amidohydrolase [Thermodesulfobacteriota bacterium]
MEKIDILLKNAAWMITMNHERTIIQDGAMAIRQDRILEVGKTKDLSYKYKASQEIDCLDKVVLPGMIDSHVHSAFQMSRGLADEVGEQAFLFERMYPYEGCMDEEDTYWSATLCALELLKHGVTCFIDPGNYEIDQTAKAIQKTGIRCVLSKSSLDIAKSSFGGLPEKFIETTDQALERSEALIERWHNKADGRIKVFFSFRGLNNSTDRLIIGMKGLAEKYNTGIQTHCAFAQKTRDASLAQHGCSEVERLHELGVLNANLVLSHVGWLSSRELVLLREYDVKTVACPSSSMHNGYGNLLMGTIPILMEMGVPMGIGSDHASSGIVDLCQEMLLVGTALKEIRLDPKTMPPERVLEMATVNGARCALWDNEIGSLEPGKMADVTIFDTQRPEWQPLYTNPLVNLVYSATGSSVDTVLVGGRVLIKAGRLLNVDEEEVYGQVKRLAQGILQKTGLVEKIGPQWPVI